MSEHFDRIEEARERNEELHYVEFHESRAYLREEDENPDAYWNEDDEEEAEEDEKP